LHQSHKGKPMDLVVHTVCFNEEAMLPHFLNYDAPQAKKIRIYDNQSTLVQNEACKTCKGPR